MKSMIEVYQSICDGLAQAISDAAKQGLPDRVERLLVEYQKYHQRGLEAAKTEAEIVEPVITAKRFKLSVSWLEQQRLADMPANALAHHISSLTGIQFVVAFQLARGYATTLHSCDQKALIAAGVGLVQA